MGNKHRVEQNHISPKFQALPRAAWALESSRAAQSSGKSLAQSSPALGEARPSGELPPRHKASPAAKGQVLRWVQQDPLTHYVSSPTRNIYSTRH